MIKTIYKYDLMMLDVQVVQLPIGAEILTIQEQYEEPKLWVLVDPNQGIKESIVIEMLGTGHHFDGSRKRQYINTFQLQGGSLVFHCFKLED